MTELIWDGKYDQNGKRVAPLRVALPFKTVETVNESTQARQRPHGRQIRQCKHHRPARHKCSSHQRANKPTK